VVRTFALAVVIATLAGVQAAGAQEPAPAISLPGVSYVVLRSGPADGAHPTRAQAVAMRYTGRLTNGAVFSASPHDGAEATRFGVKEVIPGMSAALQLMRPGDIWRITMPAYLAYGALGRRYTAPEALLKRDIPPQSTLVFDVELVSVLPGPAEKAP
jgi:FKBP-type peptidyl-prolyl cis-trans isomerase FklB